MSAIENENKVVSIAPDASEPESPDIASEDFGFDLNGVKLLTRFDVEAMFEDVSDRILTKLDKRTDKSSAWALEDLDFVGIAQRDAAEGSSDDDIKAEALRIALLAVSRSRLDEAEAMRTAALAVHRDFTSKRAKLIGAVYELCGRAVAPTLEALEGAGCKVSRRTLFYSLDLVTKQHIAFAATKREKLADMRSAGLDVKSPDVIRRAEQSANAAARAVTMGTARNGSTKSKRSVRTPVAPVVEAAPVSPVQRAVAMLDDAAEALRQSAAVNDDGTPQPFAETDCKRFETALRNIVFAAYHVVGSDWTREVVAEAVSMADSHAAEVVARAANHAEAVAEYDAQPRTDVEAEAIRAVAEVAEAEAEVAEAAV